MEKVKLTGISVYPIKSARGISLATSLVEHTGIPYDRSFAIIGSDNKIITARENSLLLKIHTKIQEGVLELSTPGKVSISLIINKIPEVDSIFVGIFKDFTKAIVIDHEVNEWISTVIQQPVRLVKTDPNSLRNMKAKYNAIEKDVIPFCDAAPLHLISEASLIDLNSRLETSVSTTRFRPNLIVKGCEAYAENNWKTVEIGNCIFQVAVKTIRCNFITIDPETTEHHPKQEPLRTLAKNNNLDNQVTFGIYLIPRQLGRVKTGDDVKVF